MCHSLWAEKRHDGPCNSSIQVSQMGLSWNRATQYLQIIHFRLGFSISHPAMGLLRGLWYLAMVWYTQQKTTNWQDVYNIWPGWCPKMMAPDEKSRHYMTLWHSCRQGKLRMGPDYGFSEDLVSRCFKMGRRFAQKKTMPGYARHVLLGSNLYDWHTLQDGGI